MRNRFIALIIIALSLLMPVMVVGGQATAVDIFSGTCGGAESNTDVCNDVNNQQSSGTSPILKVLKEAIAIISYVIGAAAVIGILVSGLRFMTASGDTQSIASARTGLIYSLVGVAVAVLAQVIVIFVLDKVS